MSASKQQHQMVLWRRGQVLELVAKVHNQDEISDILKVDRSLICRDITYLNMQAKENIRTFIDNRLPYEYEKCLIGIKEVLKIAWNNSSILHQ